LLDQLLPFWVARVRGGAKNILESWRVREPIEMTEGKISEGGA